MKCKHERPTVHWYGYLKMLILALRGKYNERSLVVCERLLHETKCPNCQHFLKYGRKIILYSFKHQKMKQK